MNFREKKFITGDEFLDLLGEVRKDSRKWRPRLSASLWALMWASKMFLGFTLNSLYASSNKLISVKY